MAISVRHVLMPWRTSQAPAKQCTRTIRNLSSTACKPQEIPPESPRYIEVPQSIQPDVIIPERIKGALPVARNVFSHQKGGMRRASPEALAKATRKAQKDPGATTQEQAVYNKWRTAMADRRRQNLEQGISELYARRTVSDSAAADLARRRARLRKNARTRAPRLEDTLTSPTIPQLLRSGGPLPDPGRDERLAEMKARVEAKEQDRRKERQAALHTLYMNAREFIINERQLDDKVEKEFGSADRPRVWKSDGPSIWHDQAPETVQQMMDRSSNRSGSFENKDATSALMRRRLRRVTEELTGGKM